MSSWIFPFRSWHIRPLKSCDTITSGLQHLLQYKSRLIHTKWSPPPPKRRENPKKIRNATTRLVRTYLRANPAPKADNRCPSVLPAFATDDDDGTSHIIRRCWVRTKPPNTTLLIILFSKSLKCICMCVHDVCGSSMHVCVTCMMCVLWKLYDDRINDVCVRQAYVWNRETGNSR
jgi:hypothetical protein